MKKLNIKPKLVLIPLLIAGVVYLIWWWLRSRSTQISDLSASNPTQVASYGNGGGAGGYNAPPVQTYDIGPIGLPPFDESSVVVSPGTSGSGLPAYTSQAQRYTGTEALPGFNFGANYGPFKDSLSNIGSAFKPDMLHFNADQPTTTPAGGDACCDSCAGDCNNPSSRFVDGSGTCLALSKNQQVNTIARSDQFNALTQRVYDSGYGKFVDQIITDPSVYANYYPDFPRDF